jgi:translation initiation factor IF-2
VATVLVETGTLRVGDAFVVGQHSGRVRAMFDERDQRVEEAGPVQARPRPRIRRPADVGDRFVVMEEEREAREVAAKRTADPPRADDAQEEARLARRHLPPDGARRARHLNLILKADVAGSVEALADSLLKLSTDEVAVEIIHSGVGAINESDVMLAAASDAIIFGFQVRPMAGVRQVAEREEIDIRLYSVIYDAIEDVRDAPRGAPRAGGEGEDARDGRGARDLPRPARGHHRRAATSSRAGSTGTTASASSGTASSSTNGTLGSLRRFKEDVREVRAGTSAGCLIHNFNDIKVGDQIEAYEVYEERRTLA